MLKELIIRLKNIYYEIKKRPAIELIVLYVAGFPCFVLLLYLIENILLHMIGLTRSDVTLLWDTPKDKFIQYTKAFMIAFIILFIYEKISNKLSKRNSK